MALANDIATNLENVTEMHEHGTTFLTAEHKCRIKSMSTSYRTLTVSWWLEVRTVCYCLFTPIGLLGNALVIASVIISKKLRTTTNILVVNLAVADLLDMRFLPFPDGRARQQLYPLPEIVCKVVAGVLSLGLSVSISTLSAIAFLRWYVITKSIRGHRGLHTTWRVTFLVIIIC